MEKVNYFYAVIVSETARPVFDRETLDRAHEWTAENHPHLEDEEEFNSKMLEVATELAEIDKWNDANL